MAELMGKLKTVLRPKGIVRREPHRDASARCAPVIRLRVIAPAVNIDPVQANVRAISPDFSSRGLQYRRDVRHAGLAEYTGLHANIEQQPVTDLAAGGPARAVAEREPKQKNRTPSGRGRSHIIRTGME